MRTAPGFSLFGKRIILRPLTDDDATEAYAGWLNDPEVNRYLETRSAGRDDVRRFIREKNEREDALLLGVFWNEPSAHIGTIKLEPIDRQGRTAVIGLLIGDKAYWGKGAGTEATNLLTEYAFGEWGLQDITLGVIAQNAPAIRVYEKCGFTVDRVEKDAVNHDGTLFDRIVMHKRSPAPLLSPA